jgi:predicted PilT family ATPase
MQTTGVKIKFETFNDHNFLIDIAANDGHVLTGLNMLQEELPAEISFHVPESYHKRIIGVGGRSIQRIMKKYGVYVKFSNAEEFAALGGYNDNEDNVVARTPAKNAVNLEYLKQSVMELVNPKDKDFIIETLSIPRRYHRILLGEKSIFIHDIESKTNSRVRFPDKESASDVVTIFGPESQVQIASAMLLVSVDSIRACPYRH